MSDNNQILVKVEGLSKKFCKDLKTSLKYGVIDLTSQVFRKKQSKELRPKEFWAVKDISFELRRGKCLGLIGHNGAGKSTLLKMLNGLINPDEGRIEMRGRIAALIELGAGFNPILTGRENVYNNGTVLGLSKKEISEKLNDIIAFAELEEFIDTPVQNYSSGMKVRLGFAIASQIQPDILIIDEVLAVGDLGFILKCFKKIDEILPNTAVIFVSHNMPMISRICSEIILMDRGEVKFQGENVAKGIDLYYAKFSNNETNIVFTDNSIEIIKCNVFNKEKNNDLYLLSWKDSISFSIIFNNLKLTKLPYFSFVIYDKEQRGIAEVFPDGMLEDHAFEIGEKEINITFKNLYLSKGVYSVTVNTSRSKGFDPILKMHNLFQIQITHPKEIWTSFLIDSEIKYIN